MTDFDTKDRTHETHKIADLVHAYGEYTNPRTSTGLDKESIATLAQEIKDRGLEHEPVIVPVRDAAGDGTVHLVVKEGQRRIAAAKVLGWTEIDCLVERQIDYSPEAMRALYADAVAVDAHREQISTAEQVVAAKKLLDSGMTQTEIGLRLNRSKSWVSQMLGAMATATPELVSTWQAGKIPDEQFKDLATVKPAQQPEALKDIVTLREKGERSAISAARQKGKAQREEAKPSKARARKDKVQVTTWDAKVKKAVTHQMEAAVAHAVSTGNRPSLRTIEEYAKLAHPGVPIPVGRDPYVRGALDMARFVVGEISDSKFEGSWRRFLDAMAKAMAHAQHAKNRVAHKKKMADQGGRAKRRPGPRLKVPLPKARGTKKGGKR